VLLGEDELEMFKPPLLEMYASQGFKPHNIRARAPGAAHKITAVFKAAEAEGRKVVCHCTGGCHRVGAVLTGWIATRYGLSYEEAAQEMMQTAGEWGVNREAPSKERFESYTSGQGW
jgi:protein-tyrosine phosphatase